MVRPPWWIPADMVGESAVTGALFLKRPHGPDVDVVERVLLGWPRCRAGLRRCDEIVVAGFAEDEDVFVGDQV